MSQWKKGRRSKKKSVSFNPNRNYINTATDEFLKNGGKITRIEMDEDAYQAFIKMREAAADEFLRG
jgi:LAS superfamily LD-carboxypeptidase LdcB